jgi:hypothetical protein
MVLAVFESFVPEENPIKFSITKHKRMKKHTKIANVTRSCHILVRALIMSRERREKNGS